MDAGTTLKEPTMTEETLAKAMDVAASEANKLSGTQDVPRAKKPNPVIAIEKGMFALKSFEDVWNIASLYFKASVAPRKAGFDSVDKVAAAIEFCNKHGLIFQAAVNNMAWIEDRLCLWGDLPTAICRMSGNLEALSCELVDAEYTTISRKNKNLDKEVFAAVVNIKVKGRNPEEYFFTQKDAERAGLINKGVYKAWKPIMFKRKAIGQALKFEMSDVLMGIGIAEYDFDTAPDATRDVTPNKPVTKSYIGDMFSGDAVQASSGSTAATPGDDPGEAALQDIGG
jgi:hypothetical protein